MLMKKNIWLWTLPLAAMGTAALCLGLRLDGAMRSSPWIAALFLLAAAGSRKLCEMKNRRLAAFAIPFGFAVVLFQLLGLRLDLTGTVAGMDVCWLFLAAACFAPAAGAGFAFLVSRLTSAEAAPARRLSDKQFFHLSFGLLLVCWLPIFLAFYPGIFSYDVLGQLIQGREMPYWKNNPLLNTLLVSGLYEIGVRTGNPNLGVALYSVLQMAVLSAAVSHAARTIRAAGCHGALCWAAVILPGILPYHGILAVSTTKDILFSAAILLLSSFLFEVLHQPERWKTGRQWIKLIVTTALMCLLRNNGWPALIVAMLLMLLLGRRKAIRALCALLAGLILFAGADSALQAACKAQDWRTSETMSVPMQQMARVITLHPEWLNDPDVQDIFQGEVLYNPTLSDPVKHIFRAEGETPISQVIGLWLRMFKAHPTDYADATLYLTRGWWDMADVSHSLIYGEKEGYMHTNVLPGYDVQRQSVLPRAESFFRWMVTGNGYQSIPVYSLLFAPAVWVWLLLGILSAALYARRADVLVAALIPFGALFTVLLGPCCLVRYAYPVILCVPFLAGMLNTKS